MMLPSYIICILFQHQLWIFYRPNQGPLRPIAPQLPPGPPGPPPRPPRPTLNVASASIVAPPPPPSPVNSSPKGGVNSPQGSLNAPGGSPGLQPGGNSGGATPSIPQVNPTRQPRPPGPIFNLIPRLPNFTELFGIWGSEKVLSLPCSFKTTFVSQFFYQYLLTFYLRKVIKCVVGWSRSPPSLIHSPVNK